MSNNKANNSFNIKQLMLLMLLPALLFSCAEDPAKSNKLQDEKQDNQEVKEKNSNLLEISGKVFSIPSPIQTAFLLKEVGTTYQAEILNPTSNASHYATKSSKALNLGIYGADLGYATIFDNTEDAISYVAITKKMSNDLGITNLFNADMMKRFEANLGNQDSLLAMVSDAFKSADQYLKNSKQDDIGVLILAGGWIETLHFASTLAKSTNSDALKNRIGEQKITIKNLINLLLPYQDKPEVADLINQLNELKDIYAGINYTYTYVEPETNPKTKTTIIKSQSKVDMTDGQLKLISEKIAQIRSSII